MAVQLKIPQKNLYPLLEKEGFLQSEIKDDFNGVWISQKTGLPHLVPILDEYPPSVVLDMLERMTGDKDAKLTNLLDECLYQVAYKK